tara:strand:- start:292 stop:585 length:294 start_codon:yes stop_codon:yes gene_type:complete
MRKITIDSVNAFLNRQTFKRQNMEVTSFDNSFYLKLHGNTIAVLHGDGTLMITDAGWKTNTTKERLNGLPNVNIHQKNFVWYLNGEEWNGNLTQIKQ